MRYLIAHRWGKGVPTLLENKATRRGISVTSKATGMISSVKRKAVSQGHINLGVNLCDNGSSRAHKKVMQENIMIKYGEAIISSPLKIGGAQWPITAFIW
jgi:hypothetical protein